MLNPREDPGSMVTGRGTVRANGQDKVTSLPNQGSEGDVHRAGKTNGSVILLTVISDGIDGAAARLEVKPELDIAVSEAGLAADAGFEVIATLHCIRRIGALN